MEIKYQDTILTLANYKEPLRKIDAKAGYGFYGTLAITKDGESIQCHICGQLYRTLGPHIRVAHKITARDYREKFQLAYTTSLVSENERERMKQKTLRWLRAMPEEKRKELLMRQLEWIREAHRLHPHKQPKGRLETMNKRGVCPDQLLDKIHEVREKIGRIPTSKEFVKILGTQRYKHLIFKIFGSWRNAIKSMGEQLARPKNEYTDDELIEYLKTFYQKNKSIPTHSDLKRGILPDYTTYLKHFGSLNNARVLANIPTIKSSYSPN